MDNQKSPSGDLRLGLSLSWRMWRCSDSKLASRAPSIVDIRIFAINSRRLVWLATNARHNRGTSVYQCIINSMIKLFCDEKKRSRWRTKFEQWMALRWWSGNLNRSIMTGRTVLFWRVRKDFEENCRSDGLSVEDTDEFFIGDSSNEHPHSRFSNRLRPYPNPGASVEWASLLKSSTRARLLKSSCLFFTTPPSGLPRL